MKLSKPKNKKSLIIVTVGLLAAAGAGYVWLSGTASHKNTSPTPQSSTTRKVNDVSYTPPTDDEKKEQDQQKTDIIKQATDGNSGTSTITASISRASQAGVGQPLVIHTIISGTASGTCNVVLSKDGQANVTKAFPITVEATYSTCANAQVDADSIPVAGTWKVEVTATSGNAFSQPAIVNATIVK